MKREFGRKLIEEFLAKSVTVTDIVDTSGAYIPDRGTPTVILFGRNQAPRDRGGSSRGSPAALPFQCPGSSSLRPWLEPT